MIFIDRTQASAPRDLLVRGRDHLNQTIRARATAGTLHSRDFCAGIYRSDDVRHRLWRMQHGKCCFCEREYEEKHSTVEHFRPKTEARDDTRNRGNKRSGYWWLAYTFENLYFCCKNCNTPKATYFPLAPGAAPLVPELLPSAVNEQILLIDPGREDPEPHIEWIWSRRFQGYVPVGKTDRGRISVRAAELDQRDSLNTLRAKYYKRHIRPVLRDYEQAVQAGDAAARAVALADAQRLSEPQAEYAGMARFLFRRKGLL